MGATWSRLNMDRQVSRQHKTLHAIYGKGKCLLCKRARQLVARRKQIMALQYQLEDRKGCDDE